MGGGGRRLPEPELPILNLPLLPLGELPAGGHLDRRHVWRERARADHHPEAHSADGRRDPGEERRRRREPLHVLDPDAARAPRRAHALREHHAIAGGGGFSWPAYVIPFGSCLPIFVSYGVFRDILM